MRNLGCVLYEGRFLDKLISQKGYVGCGSNFGDFLVVIRPKYGRNFSLKFSLLEILQVYTKNRLKRS